MSENAEICNNENWKRHFSVSFGQWPPVVIVILTLHFVYISLLDSDPSRLSRIITQSTLMDISKCDSKNQISNFRRTWKILFSKLTFCDKSHILASIQPMKSFEYFQKDTVNMKSESKFTEIFNHSVFHEEWQNHFSFQEPQRWMLPKQVSWLMWNEICRNFIHCYKPKFDVLRAILPVNSKPFWHKLRTLFAHFWQLEFAN